MMLFSSGFCIKPVLARCYFRLLHMCMTSFGQIETRPAGFFLDNRRYICKNHSIIIFYLVLPAKGYILGLGYMVQDKRAEVRVLFSVFFHLFSTSSPSSAFDKVSVSHLDNIGVDTFHGEFTAPQNGYYHVSYLQRLDYATAGWNGKNWIELDGQVEV